ncbi:hypothetical protein EC968_001426 [Mortierella alpina]|nr:hypothetical protein EC968_001426 [Mortierella alpina]
MQTQGRAPTNSNSKISRHCRPDPISLNPHASTFPSSSSSDHASSKPSTTSLVVSTGARLTPVEAFQHTSMDSFSVMTPVTPGSSHHSIANPFAENNASHGDFILMENQRQQQQQQHPNSQSQEDLFQLQTINSTHTQFQHQQQHVMYQQQQQQQRLQMQMQLQAQQQQQKRLQQQHQTQLPPRQRNALQQKILQQQQEQGFPLALSMPFDTMQRQQQQVETPHSPSLLQHQQQQHSKRGRFGAISGGTAPPTPLSADANYWPILGTSNLELIYMDPQSYQNQHNQQLQRLAPPTTVQSITPDHFQKTDFEWITDVSDIASTKAASTTTATSGIFSHSVTAPDYGPTPVASSASPSTSTSMSSTPSLSSAAPTGGNGSYDLFNTMPSASANSNGSEAMTDVSSALTATAWTTASSPPQTASAFAGSNMPCALELEAAVGFIAEGSAQINPIDNSGVRRQRSKGLKESQTGVLASSPSAKDSSLQVASESTSQPTTQPSTPSMPTPLSPMKKNADARFAVQHSNFVHVKQEPCNTSVSTPAAPTSGTSSTGTSQLDLLSLSPSTKVEPILSYGQHQRVLSTASQDSRNGGNGHLTGSMSTSPVPKAVAHLRCMSNNSSGGLSNNNSNQIMPSNLSFNVTPKQEELSHGRRAGHINSCTHASPELDADADTDADAEGEVYPDLVISGDENTASSSRRASGFKRERDLDLDGEADDDDDDDSDPENGRPATCPHCHKEFQSKGLLRSHVVSHSSDRPFVCWDCADKSYKRNHDLLRHRREKHNVDGNVVPSRGSSRSQQGSASASRVDMTGSTVERRSSGHHMHQQQSLAHHPPTVASQNPILGNSQHHRHQHQPAHHHHELMYPTHSMMYLGNLSGVSPLESTYSGASSGVEYHQPHHHPLYRTHTQESLTGLGLGVDLGAAFPTSTGLSVVTGGRVSSKGRRSSRGPGGAGPGLAPTSAISLAAAAAATAVAAAGGRKRKLSDSSVTTPTTLLGPTAMLSMMSPTMTPAAVNSSVNVNLTHQHQNQHQHLSQHHDLASHYQTSGAQYAPMSAVAFTDDLTNAIGGAFGGSSA